MENNGIGEFHVFANCNSVTLTMVGPVSVMVLNDGAFARFFLFQVAHLEGAYRVCWHDVFRNELNLQLAVRTRAFTGPILVALALELSTWYCTNNAQIKQPSNPVLGLLMYDFVRIWRRVTAKRLPVFEHARRPVTINEFNHQSIITINQSVTWQIVP